MDDDRSHDPAIEADIAEGKIFRLDDKLFKFIFGREEHKSLALDLVNSVVFPDGQDSFTGLTFQDRELSPDRDDGKGCRLDFVAEMNDGSLVNVEVQVKDRGDYPRRSLYYLTTLHASQLCEGGLYLNLKRTISIHFVNFALFPGERFRRYFCLCDEETGEKFSEDLVLLYLELPKYASRLREKREAKKPMNRLEYWLAYLAGLEGRKMPETMRSDPLIDEALNLERLFFQDRKERIQYILRCRDRMDEASREETIRLTSEARGEARGRAEGEARGRHEERLALARKMLLSMTEKQVAEITDLSLEEIRTLKP